MRSERGKVDFDHHFLFLTDFLNSELFTEQIILKKKFVQNGLSLRILLNFGSEILLNLFLAEKMVVYRLKYFVCFVATLSDSSLLFFKTLFKGKNFAVRRVREG